MEVAGDGAVRRGALEHDARLLESRIRHKGLAAAGRQRRRCFVGEWDWRHPVLQEQMLSAEDAPSAEVLQYSLTATLLIANLNHGCRIVG